MNELESNAPAPSGPGNRRWAIAGGVLLLAIAGGLGLSNPGPDAYSRYAAGQLAGYLETDLCDEIPDWGGVGELLQNQCRDLTATGQDQLRQLVAQNTERQNFGLFSLYRTRVGLGEDGPAYEFVTVGAIARFFPYRAEAIAPESLSVD